MNIAVIGTGYVGLVAGTCFSETGNQVICVDNDNDKLSKLNNARLTIYEPGLENIFKRNIKAKRLMFTNDLAKAVSFAEVIFLALPTPPGEDGAADLSHILKVATELGTLTNSYKVYVDKSTVPVGTADKVKSEIAKKATSDFDVVSNPEFLREGVAIQDFLKPDRIIIGTSSLRAQKIMKKLYAPFVRQGNPIYCVTERSAEMIKYAANSYLATRISFMNEIANLCEDLGADVDDVRAGLGSDKRIGNKFLFSGIGYGGSCFPKDIQALAYMASQKKYNFRILKAVMEVNKAQISRFIQKIELFFQSDLKNKTFAVWGLSFKPDTDDIREAPALHLIDYLLGQGCRLRVFDEEASDNVKKIYAEKIDAYGENSYDILEGADALIICTEWGIFRNPNFKKIKDLLKNPVIFDGRNIYSIKMMRDLGFSYFSVGRSDIK